ncbi:hypothetical protein C4544_03445 [candidate division WS5 bacterium]|uniref:Uncharacterized protein n=1 Tax=candidate division WS5 bacterium TaxID=2093353 RepID=A0A419DDM2_9BACT|nr:MAG: hypothetical protein C4544_03445 [candidate division WS5 bacterium]
MQTAQNKKRVYFYILFAILGVILLGIFWIFIPFTIAIVTSFFVWEKSLLSTIKKSGIIALLLVSGLVISGLIIPKQGQKVAEQPTQVSTPQLEATPLTGIKADSVNTFLATPTGKYRGATYTRERFVADGKNRIFLLQDSYDDMTIRVNGQIVPIGTYRENQACGSDACYDFAGKKFVFPAPPQQGTTVVFEGLPQANVDAHNKKQASRSWVTIKSWSGSSAKTTEPFEIASLPWKIKWSNKDIYNAGAGNIFQVYLMDAATNAPVDVLVNAHVGADESFVYQAGKFYLKVNAANGEWSVAVQELK